jgi:hypothetical protein
MRTTIILDDHLGERLRQEARRRKQSFSAFLAEAGRKALAEKEISPSEEGFELITYGKGGVRRGVDLNKTGALLAAEDEEAYRT